ncbi:FAD:protein FMN transferase, partial [Escherichia coli]|nr:FAD:protein FMN transferase [Escherichia coli]
SPWRADSEITAFNRDTRGVPVSSETALVTAAALDIATASSGWFDPTVGPVVAQLGFGPISGGSTGNWRAISVFEDRLEKHDRRVTVDLCGIAKGRALDLMAAYLRKAGHTDFLIDLGGELCANGNHPDGRAWQVAVENPLPESRLAAAGLRLGSGMAVATSGLHLQSYQLDGRRYSHIINPHRARPVDGRIASVSVLFGSAMLADAWATALTAAGDAGPELARANGIAALFLFRSGAGLRAETTGGFGRHLI